MAQYIDKSAIVAEIERLSDIISQGMITNESRLGIEYFKERVLSYINTLEVKEVDIEKEVIDWWNAHYSSKAFTFEGYSGHYLENYTVINIAKHFFELGLKAQKGE